MLYNVAIPRFRRRTLFVTTMPPQHPPRSQTVLPTVQQTSVLTLKQR